MGKSTWTYEQCCEEARKYKTKIEFRNNSRRAYDAAYHHNWMKDFTWFEEIIKPCNYWTYERCYKEAKKYKCKVDFQRGKRGAYKAALREGWLKDYTWMKTPPSHNKKWTYETCLEEAKKYTNLNEFREKGGRGYNVSVENNWIKDFDWLNRKIRQNGYWNYEHCYEEAKKYKTRTEFEKNNGSCYQVAVKNGWIDDYTWIPKRKKIVSKWTKDLCFEIGKRFKTKVEFEKNEKGCYIAAMRAGWLKEMDWFVPAVIETMDMFKKSHCVYVYKDDELNIAYIGLTSNLKVRHNRHKLSGTVHDYFATLNMEMPQPIVLIDNLTPEESRYYEDYYVNEYRKMGYNVLNKGCTGKYCGSFGGGRVKYTYEKSYEIAKQYTLLKDFREENQSCYNRARIKGWINDYTWLKINSKKEIKDV